MVDIPGGVNSYKAPCHRGCEMLITQAGFAKKIGRSRQYVNKLVKRGVIPTHDKKRVDPVEAEQCIKDHEDPRRDAQREANEARRSGADLFSEDWGYPGMTEEQKEEERKRLIEQLERKKEEARSVGVKDGGAEDVEKMSVADLNLAILKQDLRIKTATANEKERLSVPVEIVKRDMFSAARVIRDGLLGIPARMSSRIAVETDPHICRTMLEEEIVRQLAKLSEVLDEF